MLCISTKLPVCFQVVYVLTYTIILWCYSLKILQDCICKTTLSISLFSFMIKCKTPRKQGKDESVKYMAQRESKRGSYCL